MFDEEKKRKKKRRTPVDFDFYGNDYFPAWEEVEPHYMELINFIITGFPNGARFLDIGCGRGYLIKALAQYNSDNEVNFRMNGFDPSAFAIDCAESEAVPFIEFGSIKEQPIRTTYETIVANEVLEHCQDSDLTLFLDRAACFCKFFLLITKADPDDESKINIKSRADWDKLFLNSRFKKDEETDEMLALAKKHRFVKSLSDDYLIAIYKGKLNA